MRDSFGVSFMILTLFKKYLSVILFSIPPFVCDVFLSRPRLCILRKTPVGMRCLSQCIVSGVLVVSGIGDANFDHLAKVGYASFPHCKVAIFSL